MKGQDVGVGPGSEPTLYRRLRLFYVYLFSEFVHVSSYQNSVLASHL